jgi:hypothetical protein
MVEEDSEEKQNDKLNSLMLIENLGKQEEIESEDLTKIILGDFCITPKCKKCSSNARKCEHKDNR